eukprot:1147428-Pelagomonas_calceolata.AAC.4
MGDIKYYEVSRKLRCMVLTPLVEKCGRTIPSEHYAWQAQAMCSSDMLYAKEGSQVWSRASKNLCGMSAGWSRASKNLCGIRAGLVCPNSGCNMSAYISPVKAMSPLRKPVDVWSILKSPYGLMMVASVFIIFVMPKLKVRL